MFKWLPFAIVKTIWTALGRNLPPLLTHKNDNQDQKCKDADGQTGTNKRPRLANLESELSIKQDKPSFKNENGIIPDSSELLAIFPEEIWLLISNDINNKNDKINFCNSSPFFRNLLLTKRVVFLSPKVFDILLDKLYENEDDKDRSEDYLLEPHREKFADEDEKPCTECGRSKDVIFWFSEIVKLRLVCWEWCNAIDKFYQGQPHTIHLESNHIENNSFWWSGNCFSTEDVKSDDPQEFLRHHEKTHSNSKRNPFIGRSICVNYFDSENLEFFNGVLAILKLYGNNLWYCKIQIRDAFPSRTEWYTKAREILLLLPNVKVLELVYVPRTDGAYFMRNRRVVQPDELQVNELIDVESKVTIQPLNIFKNLHSLKMKNIHYPIFNEFVQKSPNLSVLKMEQFSFQEGYNLHKVPLPKLNVLQLELQSKADFKNLENSDVNWKLSELTLNMEHMILFKVPRVFKFLEDKFVSSLTSLSLKLPQRLSGPGNIILEDCVSFRLNLPKLKYLKLDISSVMVLDLLLPMKNNLECLEIQRDYCANMIFEKNKVYQSLKKKQIVEYLGWSCRILESNIWALFPELKEIIFFSSKNDKKVLHKRSEWEEGRREQEESQIELYVTCCNKIIGIC